MTGYNIENTPYVVLLGDVGTGKSTIVEKVANVTNLASDGDSSVTKSSKVFFSSDGSLLVGDTPGSNAMEDKFKHNLWIAAALNFKPVSKVFILVKAETRLDSVVDNIRKYSDRFVTLDPKAIGVLITHMDTVSWSPQKCQAAIQNELGIDSVLFSQPRKKAQELIRDILSVCGERHSLQVNDNNFLRLFKLHSNHSKILVVTAQKVEAFLDLKKSFDEEKANFSAKEQVDLIFEFQAYLEDQITVAQQSMAEELDFSFLGADGPNEAGHVANMTNQLRVILQAIRIEALSYQSDHGANDLRQCPHCGLLWAKVEGCDGGTTCGSIPAIPNDLRDKSFGIMATFNFSWLRGNKGKRGKLNISKRGTKKAMVKTKTSEGQGCGKSISWSTMKQVPVPPELMQGKITTDDVKDLPPSGSGFRETVASLLHDYGTQMTLGNKPNKSNILDKIFKK